MSKGPARDVPRYTIGEVVEMTGVSKARLDDYDRKGLLCPARVTKGRMQEWRLYSEADIDRLGQIDALLAFRFRIEEIKQILDGNGDGIADAIEERIQELRREEYRLRNLLLFTSFVDMADANMLEGILYGPADIDELADMVRGSDTYREGVKRIQGYSDDELASIFKELDDIIEELPKTDPELGFSEVERVLHRFCDWWSAYIRPLDEVGYLGFWAVFEDDSIIAAEAERVGDKGMAGHLQMLAFYMWMKQLMIEAAEPIGKIAQTADKDAVVAIENAREVVRLICERTGVVAQGSDDDGAGDADGGSGPDGTTDSLTDETRDLTLSVLGYMSEILSNDELRGYIDYANEISLDPKDITRAEETVSLL